MTVTTRIEAGFLGEVTLAAGADGLVAVRLEGEKLGRGPGSAPDEVPGASSALDAAAEWFASYAAGGRPDPGAVPLAPVGTVFQSTVWEVVRSIGYGEVVSYGRVAREVAARVGRPAMSARAVGAAIGRNPLPVIVPCHRVVAADGALTGYSGGLDRKASLLAFEGAVLAEDSRGRVRVEAAESDR
ncbi:methylated-DNA--[protein]-cysteine S-methyltransferase [Actinomyces sp. B33]|uniref:methylated-DNA--[protein]-cysteine S-methyltransferase n=1 Tax=Actinomyces sp. B33 TaxID=2942131 RepID=UPI0023425F2B|nr:methylated-DNA--[protein]-cysteine S-methyltransferase [Actinomyces sp. B33]MDC4233748.1 methylated-DNA--[protein]-cysteine S-methyltransferase [Actinomyces sp. B33]